MLPSSHQEDQSNLRFEEDPVTNPSSSHHQVVSDESDSLPLSAGRLQRPAAAGLNLVLDKHTIRSFGAPSKPPSSTDGEDSDMPDRSSPSNSEVYDLPSPLSRNSSPYNGAAPSPLSSTSTSDSAPPTPSENEDSWNLIPYHVPWGSSYLEYDSGTLPGPDGTCLFLRSPTPLKNQRTTQACEKCRERKAKCSGARPSCARCQARGHVCTYLAEPSKRVRGPSLSRRRRRDTISALPTNSHSPSDNEFDNTPRRHSDPEITHTSPASRSYLTSTQPVELVPKEEEECEEGASLQKFDDVGSSSGMSGEIGILGLDQPPPAHTVDVGMSSAGLHDHAFMATPRVMDFHNERLGAPSQSRSFTPFANIHHLQTVDDRALRDYQYHSQAAPSICAPRPIRHSSSMPFLSHSIAPIEVAADMSNHVMEVHPHVIPDMQSLSICTSTSPSVGEYSPYDPSPCDESTSEYDDSASRAHSYPSQMHYYSVPEFPESELDQMGTLHFPYQQPYTSPSVYGDDGSGCYTANVPHGYGSLHDLPPYVQAYLGQ
ncbi:hypothetical protein JAAARDRAFT_38976 [Jaapia argillacea MUCL 33604]|uniref:Zn(2)-C6 fungal-type domain-containing protein n=1 Tax=Jaapia argillacea MUCL 33604 TaxID=933084 RepID=A0A067PTJ0_9AGAM|nr:hypothetical protein JAAARDRAFT_38976 [Jaapia argillacea MUCL 33604]